MAITLPPGASADRDLARRIAEDNDRVTATASYWRKRFEAFAEHVVETGEITSDGLKFSVALGDGELDALVPATKGLIAPTESNEVFKRSGCLMSAAEIVAHVDSALDASKLADALQALTTATIPIEDPGMPSLVTKDQVIAAITLAREFFDVVRRFAFCREHAVTYALTTAELLSLYRREGAYAVAPPVSSYRHGPVIRTSDSGCRTHAVSLFDATTTRGGYIISHSEAAPRLPSANSAESRAFGIMFRNLVTIGGIDTVVSPRLPAEDELIFFLDAATKASPMPAPLESI